MLIRQVINRIRQLEFHILDFLPGTRLGTTLSSFRNGRRDILCRLNLKLEPQKDKNKLSPTQKRLRSRNTRAPAGYSPK